MDDDSIKPITNQGFFTYVFKLSKFKQEDLMNIVQYTLLSIVPVILFVYFTKKYFPSLEESDSSLYIFTVTVIELIFMIIGIFFIDRIINYIPTYSGKYYETINLTTIVVIFVLFMLITETGFKKRTLVMLERFDKFFFIDDALIRKFGGEVRPFNFATDEIFRDKKQPNKNNKNNGSNKGNAGAGAAPRVEGMAQQHSPPPPIPVAGPMIPQQTLPMGGGGGGYNGGGNGGYNGGGNGGGNMNEGFVPEYAEPVAANGALSGGGWGSAW
jgi:hypothetical protein